MFAPPTKLGFEDGKEVNVGKASALAVGDWDGDGDLDLLIGVINGGVWFVPRVAQDLAKGFGSGRKMLAASKTLRVPAGDAGPTIADFDRDGITDLLVGAGNGSVLWFRRVLVEGKLVLQKPKELLPRGSFNPKTELEYGSRSKLQVLDWNGDGRMDLLVGDFASERGKPPQLTEEQKAKKEALMARRGKISKGLGERIQALSKKVRRGLGYQDGVRIPPTERKIYNRALLKAYATDAAYQKLRKESKKVWDALAPLTPKLVSHGRVRLFLQ